MVWNDYAYACYKLDELDAAETAFNKAVELNPDYALAYRNLAVVNWQKNNNIKAAELMSKALTLNGSDIYLRFAAHAYVLLCDEQKNKHEKIQSLEKAAGYYRRMKDLTGESKDNLERIEKLLKQN